MKSNDIPKLMPVPFGVNGPREELLETSPAGNRSASYADGFPPITMLLKQAGGLPPKGENMNQILFELANGQRWSNSGAGYKFNKAFSEAVGGYPKGAQLLSNDGAKVYVSTKDDNKTDFNTSPDTDWVTLGSYIGLGDYAKKTDLELKFDKSAVVQTTGISATDVMSQKAVSQALNGKASVFDLDGKIDNTSVVQETGTSSSLIMSQKAVTENTIPVGTVIFVSHDQNVTGRFLKTHGTAVSRTVYADLFAAIGTTYGTGDGSTTFNLPDTREEFPRFTGGGRAAGSKQSDATRNFNGSVSGRTATSTGRIFARDASGVFGTTDTNGSMLDSGSATSPLPTDRLSTLTIDLSRQLPTANEFRPRNIALAGWIKY